MALIRGPHQIVLVCASAALAFFMLAVPDARPAPAGESAVPLPARPLTDADLEKINKMIADKGSEIRLNRETTSLLGVTRGDELLISRGIAVKDETGDIHEFEPLSDDKGYLVLKLNPQINTIYWMSKAFVLTGARSRVPGAPSEEIPIAEAQAGAGRELAYWAAFAREQP